MGADEHQLQGKGNGELSSGLVKPARLSRARREKPRPKLSPARRVTGKTSGKLIAMQVELTIKNYRCFPDTTPLRFEIREGFTAFVGVNNSGKSSILKFLYEFRNLFQIINNSNRLWQLLRGNQVDFSLPQSVKDIRELFSDSNDRDLTIEFKFTAASPSYPQPSFLSLRVPRDRNTVHIIDFVAGDRQHTAGPIYLDHGNWLIHIPHLSMTVDFSELAEFATNVANSMYIGAFRNAINTGTNENYFDIAVGQGFIQRWRAYKTGSVKRENELIKQITRDIDIRT